MDRSDKEEFLGWDGGHILGLSLGGVNVNYNVVPMYPAFNRGTWKAVESEIEHDAIWAYSGMNYTVVINLTYNGTYRSPKSLSAVGYADKYDATTKTTTQKRVKDYGTKTQPDDIEVTARASTANEKLYAGKIPKKRRTDIIETAADYIDKTLGDPDGAKHLRTTGHLRKSDKAEYPDDPDERPYEYLDILTFAGEINPQTTLGRGRIFSAKQRELILQTNMARHKGSLQSDDPNDPINEKYGEDVELSEEGTDDFPEIDHIIPKSLGGSNMFSNARVVSWLLNNVEDRVKDISKLVDITRLAPPTLSGATIRDKLESVLPFMLMSAGKTGLSFAELVGKLSQDYNVTVTANWRSELQDVLDAMKDEGAVKLKTGKYRV
ncbi:MAG: DNA/RNA non-specific endonuclease [Chloroflexi bacterium]|nr:DNA/RNA non-specific endonuclease [Chloroflexota bacterium]